MACSGAGSRPITNTNTSTWTEPCPRGAALEPVARAAFGTDRDVTASCVALRSHGTWVWLIDGSFQQPDHAFAMRTVVLDAATRAPLSTSGYENHVPSDRRFEIADLDGDGSDELIELQVAGSDGTAWVELVVHAMRAHAIVELAKLPLSHDNEGAILDGPAKRHDVCNGTWRIAGGTIEVTGTGGFGNPEPSHCAKDGTHRYALVGGRLVER